MIKFPRFLLSFYFFLMLPFCAITTQAATSSTWGVGADYAGDAYGIDNASRARGLRLTVDDYVPTTQWHDFQLYFQGSAAFYHSNYDITQPKHSDELWVFAVTPVIRYHFTPDATIDPFIEGGSGPGYLSTIYYENRNFGIHFTLQNMIGAGAVFGQDHQWSMAARLMHYSNAGISDHNRGLTVPVILSISYQF